jgi:hypothetical protein
MYVCAILCIGLMMTHIQARNYLTNETRLHSNVFCVTEIVNPLTPELNPSAQRCLTRFFTGDFAAQLSISQKALGTLPEDDSVIPKHVGATIHN